MPQMNFDTDADLFETWDRFCDVHALVRKDAGPAAVLWFMEASAAEREDALIRFTAWKEGAHDLVQRPPPVQEQERRPVASEESG